jgi:hypothetical protein
VGLFRRHRETLNEQLAREAGLGGEQRKQTRVDQTAPPAVFELLGGTGGGVVGPELCDSFALTEAPGLDCDDIAFWALPDGELFVAEKGSANASLLADAVEKHIHPPYKALASRQDDDLWAVAAMRMEVARFDFDGGDSLTLGRDEVTAFTVDGNPSDTAAPKELEAIGEAVAANFYVEADRIAGDVWEVSVTAL